MIRARAAAILAAALALLTTVGCGGGSEQQTEPPYTTKSIRAGFVTPADLGKGAMAFEEQEHASHVIYTPPESVPTCPYVQRADDVKVDVDAAVELVGGNSTGRFIVAPRDPARIPLPVVTQGAVVFKSDALAETGMKQVTGEAAKCPNRFTILGGPPQVVGDFTVTRRPFELEGWKGFAQQLSHTATDLTPDIYDDLVTVVVRKANAILYAGFAQTKKVGERSDSGAKAEDVMKRTLARLG
ncbi:MAG TPA: hypothetical protein VFG79_12150 [Solirubrobacter sp.]|nr:hypothetical protein [Solirubrobacter sp.]